ncbi:uncharacterized protein LOC123270903 [Cotesia glomerata]|nr:uncharacterized protein LOC123270903 [Cotesia glomerata]
MAEISCYHSLLYDAIKVSHWITIRRLLERLDVNSVLTKTGPEAGFTALHLACLENNEPLVRFLIYDNNANVEVPADDGTLPIHLAGLLGRSKILLALFGASANIDAKFGREIFSKYAKKGRCFWSDDFGDEITLLTYAVINEKVRLAESLIGFEADVMVKSINNKTLLMYAIEDDNYKLAIEMIKACEDCDDLSLLDAVDNDGLRAIHYIEHREKYRDYRYDEYQLGFMRQKYSLVEKLIDLNVDINATANGNSDTLLLNMAAYRGCVPVVRTLMALYDASVETEALCYAAYPIEYPEKYCRWHDFLALDEDVERNRELCIEVIVKNFTNRRIFGLPVHPDELWYMDNLIAENPRVRNLVKSHEKVFINRFLKENFVHYGNESATVYDIAMMISDRRMLKRLVGNKEHIEAIKKAIGGVRDWYDSDSEDCDDDDDDYLLCLDLDPLPATYRGFTNMLMEIIGKAEKKSELLDMLSKIAHLKKAIPLPYEIILWAVDYLSNKDLEKFVNCFYS